MTGNDRRISREFSTRPSEAQQTLMAAMSEWLNTTGANGAESWDEVEWLTGSMVLAARFGDSTCRGYGDELPAGHDPRVVNYPTALRLATDGQWEASYQCRVCGRNYRCWWGDDA